MGDDQHHGGAPLEDREQRRAYANLETFNSATEQEQEELAREFFAQLGPLLESLTDEELLTLGIGPPSEDDEMGVGHESGATSAQANAVSEYERLAASVGSERPCCRARWHAFQDDAESVMFDFGVDDLGSCPRCCLLMGIAGGIWAQRKASSQAGDPFKRFSYLLGKKRPRSGKAKKIVDAVFADNPRLADGLVPWSHDAFVRAAKNTDNLRLIDVEKDENHNWSGNYLLDGVEEVVAKVSSVHKDAAKRLKKSSG